MAEPRKGVSEDSALIADVERLRNGANAHWISGTLYKYRNGCEQSEKDLRVFVAQKGRFRPMTAEHLRHLWDKFKYTPTGLPAALDELAEMQREYDREIAKVPHA